MRDAGYVQLRLRLTAKHDPYELREVHFQGFDEGVDEGHQGEDVLIIGRRETQTYFATVEIRRDHVHQIVHQLVHAAEIAVLEDVTLRFTTFTEHCYLVLPSPHIQARHFPFQRGSFLRVLKCEILGEPRLPHLVEDQEELNHV